MKKIIGTVKKQLRKWHDERAKRIEAERQSRLDAEARLAVQVMEFKGDIYVSVNGVPLFSEEALDGIFLPTLVDSGRKTYKDWKEEKLWERGATDVSIRS